MDIIGFCGPAGSGKDTVAGIVASQVGGRVKRQGFADALKISAARALGFDGDDEACIEFCNLLKVHGDVRTNIYLPEHDIDTPRLSGREFLQRFGTEAHRDVFGQDFWIDAVLPEGRDDCDLLLIPDVRFDNEAERIRERGGELWQINRPNATPVEAHASEAGIDPDLVTLTVQNTGSIPDLQDEVAELIGAIPTVAA